MFPLDHTHLDKSLPVPVGRQLYGLIAYAISSGAMPDGERLPSVRDLSQMVGLATMTVNRVYKDLAEAGLIGVRKGLGAFVTRPSQRIATPDPERAALQQAIDGVLARAGRLGIGRDDLMAMIGTQMQVRRLHAGLRLLFVGVFAGPTADYIAEIRPFLAPDDWIDATTLDALRADEGERRRCREADAVLTVLHRQGELETIVPEVRAVGLRFIPSEATRRALAGLDPRDRIAAVTRFEDYIAVMRPSIRQFAPHVSDILVTASDAPGLGRALADRTVLVYATGADEVADLMPPGTRAFEYRHTPDPAELGRVLVPALAGLRSARAAASAAPPALSQGASARRRPAAALPSPAQPARSRSRHATRGD
jgi:DNA-binding transcriptional regulator YhcF (GntR family)